MHLSFNFVPVTVRFNFHCSISKLQGTFQLFLKYMILKFNTKKIKYVFNWMFDYYRINRCIWAWSIFPNSFVVIYFKPYVLWNRGGLLFQLIIFFYVYQWLAIDVLLWRRDVNVWDQYIYFKLYIIGSIMKIVIVWRDIFGNEWLRVINYISNNLTYMLY